MAAEVLPEFLEPLGPGLDMSHQAMTDTIVEPLQPEGAFLSPTDELGIPHQSLPVEVRTDRVREGRHQIKFDIFKPRKSQAYEIPDNTAALVVPGAAGIPLAYGKFAKAQASMSKTTVLIHTNPSVPVPETVLAVGHAIRERLESDKVDAEGHSKGGVDIIDAANQDPSLFRSIIISGSPGLYRHNLGNFVGQTPVFVCIEGTLAVVTGRWVNLVPDGGNICLMSWEMIRYFLPRPLRVAGSIIKLTWRDIRPAVASLRAKPDAPRLGLLDLAKDRLVSGPKIVANSAHQFDEVQTVKDGRHSDFQLRPFYIARFALRLSSRLNQDSSEPLAA